MRLLFVLSSMPVGGLEVFTANMANRMAAQGHDVSVLVFKDESACLQLIKQNNVNVISAGRNFKYNPLFLLRVATYVIKIKPDVILSLSEFAYFVTEMVLRFLRINITHFIRFAWSKPITLKDRIFTRIFVAFAKFWKASYIFVSKVQQEYYRSVYKIPLRKSVLIYNGIDTNFFRPADKRKNKILTVAHVANARPVKDQWTLLKAMVKFNESSGDWRLLFVGDDHHGLLPQYESFLRNAGVHKNVRFSTTFDRRRIKDVLRCSDVFVLTSLSEGLPNAPLEAMSVGIPCVLTNVGGCIEVVTEGSDGFLIEPGDYETLSSRLLTLHKDRRLLWRFGKNARRTAMARFNLDKCVDDYIRAFSDS